MKETIRLFLDALEVEERRAFGQLSLDTVGLGFITAIKEFDYYYYNFLRNERTEDTDLHMHILQLGLPRLVAGVLAAIPEFQHPTITFQSDNTLIHGALGIIGAYGFIEHGKRYAHAAFAGECRITIAGENSFDVVLPDMVHNMEEHEAHVERHYNRLHRERVDAMAQETFAHHMGRINSLLRDNVRVYEKHFIGYDAHPDLDDFFFGLATVELQYQPDWDTFHWGVKFGGVSMQKYMLALTYCLSLAIKHEKFCEALVDKHPEIRLRDILTITSPRQDFEENLIRAINMYGPSYEGFTPVTPEEARTILSVLSVSRKNLEVLSSTMAPTPFLIEFSETSWVTSVASVQIDSVAFLLNSLRFNFPSDYDRNQQSREGSMQRAMRRLLSEALPDVYLVDNIAIRRDGRVMTDIDFAAVDEKDGTVILFQLKHQDRYGGDVRRRSNRAGRLRKEVQHWLSATRAWLTEMPEALSPALRLKNSFTCSRVYLVVVARHFAHFLSEMDLQDDAAYATWTQFFDALTRLQTEDHPKTLWSLADLLQRFMSHRMVSAVAYDLVDRYTVEKLTYTVRPESSVAEATENRRPESSGQGGA